MSSPDVNVWSCRKEQDCTTSGHRALNWENSFVTWFPTERACAFPASLSRRHKGTQEEMWVAIPACGGNTYERSPQTHTQRTGRLTKSLLAARQEQSNTTPTLSVGLWTRPRFHLPLDSSLTEGTVSFPEALRDKSVDCCNESDSNPIKRFCLINQQWLCYFCHTGAKSLRHVSTTCTIAYSPYC